MYYINNNSAGKLRTDYPWSFVRWLN